MPMNFESYCAVVTPWRAHVDGRSLVFEDFDHAYALFEKPRPANLTLEGWHDDFQILEFSHELPALLRDLLRKFSRDARSVFVRCDHGGETNYWKIERDIFLELSDP